MCTYVLLGTKKVTIENLKKLSGKVGKVDGYFHTIIPELLFEEKHMDTILSGKFGKIWCQIFSAIGKKIKTLAFDMTDFFSERCQMVGE